MPAGKHLPRLRRAVIEASDLGFQLISVGIGIDGQALAQQLWFPPGLAQTVDPDGVGSSRPPPMYRRWSRTSRSASPTISCPRSVSSPAAPAPLPTARISEPRGAAEPDGAPLAALVGWLRTELAVAQQAGRARPLLVGVVGLPGCGKSTLAASLIQALFDVPSIVVSLDDFYLPADERRARGLPCADRQALTTWRCSMHFSISCAVPSAPCGCPVRSGSRASPAAAAEVVCADCAACAVSYRRLVRRAPAPGYEPLSAALDRLIYLDMAEGTPALPASPEKPSSAPQVSPCCRKPASPSCGPRPLAPLRHLGTTAA